ncbi:MAG: CatA-like O-acetyltransferase [Oscillospiraceae bacterium]
MPDESYCYCVPKTDLPFDEFLDYTREAQRRAVEEPSIEEQGEADSLLFISCIPWVSQTAVVQPVPSPADSNPRITWGKYFERCGNVYLPVSVLCHHALVDGLHIGRFYAALDREISRLCDEIEGKNQA